MVYLFFQFVFICDYNIESSVIIENTSKTYNYVFIRAIKYTLTIYYECVD